MKKGFYDLGFFVEGNETVCMRPSGNKTILKLATKIKDFIIDSYNKIMMLNHFENIFTTGPKKVLNQHFKLFECFTEIIFRSVIETINWFKMFNTWI